MDIAGMTRAHTWVTEHHRDLAIFKNRYIDSPNSYYI